MRNLRAQVRAMKLPQDLDLYLDLLRKGFQYEAHPERSLQRDEIEYLMSRGLDEDEATATIIRGFLDVKIAGLPDALQRQIDASIDVAEKAGF